MYYEEYTTCSAKTNPFITIFEHSSDVLQVLNYFLRENRISGESANLLRVAALVHDVGKIKKDIRGGRWIHTPYSSSYLKPLLQDRRFQDLVAGVGVDLSTLDYDILLRICEEHHNPSPELLRQFKGVILIPISDTLASSIEMGMVGNIEVILRSSPYSQINFELLKNLGFNRGFNCDIHRIDLPSQFTEDLFLADMVFKVLQKPMSQAGVVPLIQKGSSLWLIGQLEALTPVLNNFVVNPRELYDCVFDEGIYDSLLSQLPPAVLVKIDTIKYILVNERIACKLAVQLLTRKKVQTLFEKYNLSHLTDSANDLLKDQLVEGIDHLWTQVRSRLIELEPQLHLPENITRGVLAVASGKVKRPSIRLVHVNKSVLDENKATGNKGKAEDIKEFLKLFDASHNSYCSLTNILLEFIKMDVANKNNDYSLNLKSIVLLNGQSLEKKGEPIDNAKLCPLCLRNQQQIEASALITGNPKTDSHYQIFHCHGPNRPMLKVCFWCFLTGYVDLPLAVITKDGQSISKKREYLLFTSHLPEYKLQKLVDFAQYGRYEKTAEGGDAEEESQFGSDWDELQEMLGISFGYDELGVLGASRKRLSYLKGFVLPTTNTLHNLVGVRIPFERLLGEDKVSGAVRRELVKATMYDIYQATGAPSMHYNTVTEAPFSVDGYPLEISDMKRASIAYRIANRYARFGRYRQLNSGLFLLLLTKPRQAATAILRNQRRGKKGQYLPGKDRIKELISLVEKLALDRDWQFDLGLKIVGTLVDVGLTKKARSFHYGPGVNDVYSGFELVKWIQRIKMIRDETSARAWGTMLINALKRGDLAHKEYILQQGGQISAPGEKTIRKIIDLVEDIITTCREKKFRLSDFSRDIANMDYYLLFYYNQKSKEVDNDE